MSSDEVFGMGSQVAGNKRIGSNLLVKFSYALATILLLALPWLVTSLFKWATFGGSIFDVTPVWNDELIYWHGIHTYRKVGWSGGYYTFNELPAPASFTRFDAHGPVFFVVMGILSSFRSWSAAQAVYTNWLAIAIGALTFICLIRASLRQVLVTIALTSTCWTIPLFLPMTMQECLHIGAAFIAAGILAAAFKEPARWTIFGKVIAVFFIILLGLIRPLWSFSLLALLYFWARGRSRSCKVAHAALLLPMIPLCFSTFTYLIAPYPAGTFSRGIFDQLGSNPVGALSSLLSRIPEVFHLLGRGLPIEIATRQEVLILFVMIVAAAVMKLVNKKREKQSSPVSNITVPEATGLLLAHGTVVLMILALHDIFDLRDFRVFAPHLLSTLLFLIATNRQFPVSLAILFQITVLPSALDSFVNFNSVRFSMPQPRVAEFAARALPHIQYDRTARSGWCNTLLTQAYHRYNFPPEVAALPAGVGFSVVLSGDEVKFPLKSRYFLFDSERAQRFAVHNRMSLLEDFGQLKLYRNLEANCE